MGAKHRYLSSAGEHGSPALERGGYLHRKKVVVGARPGGGAHKVDLLGEKADKKSLIAMKGQQTSGTAEQKVPFEIIC